MNEQLLKIADGWLQKSSPTFNDLSEFVIQTHQSAQYTAIKAVNQMATLRNWLIGCYIVEYEQKGSDRAKYGERLLKRLEERVNTKGLNETLFRNSRTFYNLYPQVAGLFPISATTSYKLIEKIHPTPSDELKNDEFRHEYLGQLNAYVSYYKENEMHEGDNPPVGILLCTRKGKKMVEYAIAGTDNNLFVSTYMLQLPDRATLERFLSDELQDMHEMDM